MFDFVVLQQEQERQQQQDNKQKEDNQQNMYGTNFATAETLHQHERWQHQIATAGMQHGRDANNFA
jgi:hypothetical protein